MKVIFYLIIFCLSLSGYELSQNYDYNRTIIYSNDLFPDIPKKFEILKIPDDKTQYRLDSRIIAKTFELNNIPLDISKTRFVNFTKHSPVDFSAIKQQLESMLRGHYPSIRIESIFIAPRGYLPSLGKEIRGVFDDRFYQNAEGTFYIIDAEGIRHYCNYSVDATLDVLHTSQKVDRKEPLNGFNTQLKPIHFQAFKDNPLTVLPEQNSRYKCTLNPSHLLTLRDIETIPLVLKNEKVVAEVKDQGIIVEFEATATQEGLLYDIITIQKSDGKRAKAKVIGENRVELQ
jgi:flagella basal body P-ring formation protein FlgA